MQFLLSMKWLAVSAGAVDSEDTLELIVGSGRLHVGNAALLEVEDPLYRTVTLGKGGEYTIEPTKVNAMVVSAISIDILVGVMIPFPRRRTSPRILIMLT
jgi:hypothetical protein